MLFHVVLLLELRESEQDPILKCIPTLIAISSHDLDSVLKTVVKAEGFERVVRPPHIIRCGVYDSAHAPTVLLPCRETPMCLRSVLRLQDN
jgi:hypothetical protein